MTEGQRQLWKMRLQEWGSLIAGALVGAAVVYVGRTYLAVLMGREAMVLGPVIGAVLGWGAHFAWDMNRGSSPNAGVSSGTLALMRLEEFLAMPDAVVAPNQDEEVSAKLAKWLRAYAKALGRTVCGCCRMMMMWRPRRCIWWRRNCLPASGRL